MLIFNIINYYRRQQKVEKDSLDENEENVLPESDPGSNFPSTCETEESKSETEESSEEEETEGTSAQNELEDNPNELEDDPNGLEDEEDQAEDDPCQICLEPYKAGDERSWSRVSTCRHSFHKSCIVTWLEKHDDCPSCRAKFLSFDADLPPQPGIDVPPV